MPAKQSGKVTIQLPNGFALDNADAPAAFSAGAVSKYDLKVGMTKNQKTLVYNRSFFFGGNDIILFPPDRYEQVKQLFDQLNKGDNHTITLRQNASGNP